MRLKDTIDFIGLWKMLNNENFNRVEFEPYYKKVVEIHLLCLQLDG